MLARRLLVAALALAATAPGRAQSPERVLKPAEIKEVFAYNVGTFPVTDSKTPGNIVRKFRLSFYNDSKEEVTGVDVAYESLEQGRVAYRGGPFHLTTFHTDIVGRTGTALPGVSFYNLEPFAVDYPSERWNTESRDHFVIVGVHVAGERQNLHDVGHLWTWLRRTKDDEVLARLKLDPAILAAKDDSGLDALIAAYACSSAPVIQAMLAAGANFTPQGPGMTPLHYAAINDHVGPLAFALARGVPVDAENVNGQTPLAFALTSGQLPNAQWLLAHGADPNHPDHYGIRPVLTVLGYKESSYLETLIKAGARLDYRDPNGYGLMELGVSNLGVGPSRLAILVRAGLSVNDANPTNGVTPLMLAARSQSNPDARWLILMGARLDAKDKKGQTVLDYARMSNTLHTDGFFRREVLDKLPAAKIEAAGGVPKG